MDTDRENAPIDPGPEPDTSDAAEPDPGSDIDAEDAPQLIDDGHSGVDRLEP